LDIDYPIVLFPVSTILLCLQEWRRLHNKEIYALYSPTSICMIKLRRLRWTGHVVGMEESRIACRFSVGKPEARIPLGKRWHRWEDNIEMDLIDLGWVYGLDRCGSG
jgi:hypothetical protein